MRSRQMGIRVREGIVGARGSCGGCRIAILTNILQPYRVAVFRELEKRCESLQLFVSTPVEEGLRAYAGQGGLRVVQQRSVQWLETERHAHHFTQPLSIQFAYRTIAQFKRVRPDV